MLFRSLIQKDKSVDFEYLEQMTDEELVTYSFKRGINIEQENKAILADLKL